MRRVVTKHNKVTPAPAGAFVEVVRDAGSSKESQTQYLPLSEVGAAPAGTINPVVPSGALQELTGTGALADISLSGVVTTIDTTGVASTNLPVGTSTGQLKTIRMVGDIGDCTVTVAGTQVASFILNDVGDELQLMWDGNGWIVLDNVNLITGLTAVIVTMV